MPYCRTCGNKLIGEWISGERAKYLKLDVSTAKKTKTVNQGRQFERKEYFFGNYGKNGNNHFCSLRCGYNWAVRYLGKVYGGKVNDKSS